MRYLKDLVLGHFFFLYVNNKSSLSVFKGYGWSTIKELIEIETVKMVSSP